MLDVSDRWKAAYPGATVGILAMDHVANPAHHPTLEARIAEGEAELRARFGALDRAALRAAPPLAAYAGYYGRYRKTYHVQLQLESVALKGRSLPRGPALVAAMVMVELRNLLLTAGHDLDAIRPPVTLDVATGHERYVLLGGGERDLTAGDMMMADGLGVISSVLHGPDARTRIAPTTRRVLFAVYAPAGVGQPPVARHLEDLREMLRLVAPEAEVLAVETHGAPATP